MYIHIHTYICDIIAQSRRKDNELFGFKLSNIASTLTNLHLSPEPRLTDVTGEGR